MTQSVGASATSGFRITRTLTIVGLVLLAVIFALGWDRISSLWAGASLHPSVGLSIPSQRLDFGEVWEDSRFNWTVPIENQSTQAVEIEGFASSCTCLEVEPRSLTIPADETRDITLILDLAASRSRLPDSEWRDFEASIRPKLHDDSDSARTSAWTVRGRIHTAIRIEQPQLDIGRHSESLQPLPVQSFVASAYVPLQSLVAESNSTLFRVEARQAGTDTKRFELTVEPSKLPVGPVEFEIALIPVLPGGARLPRKALKVTGSVVPDFQISPPAVLFGARPVGELAEESLTLYSLANESFEIAQAQVEGTGLTVDRMLSRSGMPFFLVKQKILKAGHQTARIVFHLKNRSGKTTEVAVSVSYHGIQSGEG